MTPRLIQTQSPAPHLSVSVWREAVSASSPVPVDYQYRKIWKDEKAQTDSSWLSWAHHEHLMLSLLSQRSIQHVVKVSGLQIAQNQVELVTLDAGPDFLRDWLLPAQQSHKPTLWRSEADALKFLRACLKALLSLHRLGVIHGDLKADNLCVSEDKIHTGGSKRLDLSSLTMIDFAYALYREAPLKCVLPTDPARLDYLPDFYRQAIQGSQASQNPGLLLSVACANIDLYSLSCLLKQTVEPGLAASWPMWTKMVNSLHQMGARQQKPFSIWGTPVFDQPTRSMLKQVESSLLRLKVPLEQWDWADTVFIPQAAVTPLMVEPTPVIAMTPLINREWAILPIDGQLHTSEVVPAKAALPLVTEKPWEPVPSASNDDSRRFILAGLLGHAMIFFLIDRGYARHDLLLTNMGYACGLLSVLFGSIISLQTVRALATPKNRNLNWWSVFHGLLISTAAYFSYTLAFSLENIAVVALLTVQTLIGMRLIRIAVESRPID